MPSYVIHLSCATRILERCPIADARERNLFCLGNIAADMCRDKRITHFWDDETYRLLVRRPNLKRFLSEYGSYMDEPFVRGYYAHLLLDFRFLEQYWGTHFRFYNEQMLPEEDYDAVAYAEVAEQGRLYGRQDFFSKQWYYGDYDLMNGYFANKYRIKFPDTELSEPEQRAAARIREIDRAYARTALADARTKLEASVRESDAKETPDLRIFRLPELVQLVETTAEELRLL